MTVATEQEQLSELAPRVLYFYFATMPSQTDKGRRFLHSIHRPDKSVGEVRVTLSPPRGLAKPFDSLALARAHADFLKSIGVAALCVVLEPGVVVDRQSFPKHNQHERSKIRASRCLEFTWR